MITLSIIIVNYNVKAYLKNCIISVLKATKEISAEIIIVDNASNDGSEKLIRSEFPGLRYEYLQENIGYGRANNLGVKKAVGKYLCILNPDTVVQENTFTQMIDEMEKDEQIGLAGCKILNSDGTFQLACRRSFPTPWVAFTKISGLSQVFPKSKLFAKYNLTYLSENERYEVDAISGSFMFLKRDTFLKINGFDEDYFMYGEDLDLCYRIKKLGLKILYIPSTQIIHFKGESTRRSNIDEVKLFYGAMQLFVKKHFSYSILLGVFLPIAIFLRKILSYIAKKFVIISAMLVDLILFNLTLYVSEIVYSSIIEYGGFPAWSLSIVFTIPALIFIIISFFVGAYKSDNFSISKIILSILLNFVIITSLTFFFRDFAFSRAIVLITYLFLLFVLPLWRILIKVIFSYPKNINSSISNSKTILVGTNENAIELIKKLKSSKSRYYEIVGLIDNTLDRIGEKLNDVEIIGSTELLKKVIHDFKINNVIFASDFMSFEEILKIVAENDSSTVHYQIVDSKFNYLVGKKDVVELEEIPFIEINYNLQNPSHRFIKRAFDIAISILLLIGVYPFILFFKLIANKSNKLLYLPFVLIGKYSFVGTPINDIRQKKIFGKPGLTGIVQINSNRNLSNEEMNNLNTYYAKNQNIWLDIEIITKTIQNIIRK